jgi:N-acetylglutamate synthase-like GNAT family acetyltransferase
MDGTKMVGLFWGAIDPVAEGIFISIVSVDKEYQDGKVIQRAVSFFKDLGKELGLSRIFALSSRAKAGLRLGWKDTKLRLMEV